MPNGDVYVTDSQSGGIYKLSAGAGEVVEVLPPGTYTFPNGITRTEDGRLLFVAHGAGVDRIEVGTGRRLRLASPDTLNLGGIDGLAFHRNTLIAHQPGWFNRVVRLRLDPRQERIASWEVLERHHPRFRQPTTGEVAGDLYYYIANAQLRSFRDGKILPWDSLAPVLVLKTDLSDARPKAGEAVRRSAPQWGGARGRRRRGSERQHHLVRRLRRPGPGHREAGGPGDEVRHRQHLQDAHAGGGPRAGRCGPARSRRTGGALSPRLSASGAGRHGAAHRRPSERHRGRLRQRPLLVQRALRAGQRLPSDRRGAHDLFARHTDGVRDRSLHDRRQGAGARRRESHSGR